jgi:hypothetical protein
MEYPNEIKELFKYYDNHSLYVDTPEDWFPFVIKCHEELLAIDPNYKIFQIKEKFGGLRYYFTPSRPENNHQMLQVTLNWEREIAEHEQSKRRD